MENPELFCTHFLDIMIGLADDKVVNVKLVLAETVKKHFNSNGKLITHEKFINLKKQL